MWADFLSSPYGLGLGAMALWAAIGHRYAITARRRTDRDVAARRQVRSLRVVFFLVALAATVFHPAAQRALSAHLGEWPGSVLRIGFALGAYLLGISVCYEFAPHLRPRRNWPLFVGVFTLSVYALLAWTEASGRLIQSVHLTHSTLADLIFDAAILVLVARVGIPAIVWAHSRERQRPMRLRFLLMLAMHAAIGSWMVLGIAEALAELAGLALDASPLYVFIFLSCVVTFLISHFVPAEYYVTLVRGLDYCADLWALWGVRALEIRAAAWTDRKPVNLTAVDALLAPGAAVYRSTIAILDARKPLKAHANPSARSLGRNLDALARPDLEYLQIIRHLRRVGQRELRPQDQSR